MAVTYVTESVPGGNPTTSITVTLPTTQAGDILVFEYTHRGSGTGTIGGTSITTGGLTWTNKHSQLYASSAFSGHTYWTRATGDHAGQTVSASSLTNSCAGFVTVYRGALASGDPLADATVVGEQNASGNETQAQITTATAGAWVVLVVANSPDVNVTNVAATSPASLTVRAEKLSTGGTDASIAHASAEKASAGATGAFTWAQTDGASGSWAYAIKPAPVSVTGTGALSSGSASADGAGVSGSTGSGALSAQSSAVDGAGVSGSTGSGALAAQAATVSGEGTVEGGDEVTGTGALVAGAASVSGEGLSLSTGSGALSAQAASVAGEGVSSSSGSGALVAQAAAVAGEGEVTGGEITGVGVLEAQGATVSGSGDVFGGAQPAVEQPSGGWFMRPLRKRRDEEGEEKEAEPQTAEAARPGGETLALVGSAESAELVKVKPLVIDAGPVKRAARAAALDEVQRLRKRRRRDAEMLLLLS